MKARLIVLALSTSAAILSALSSCSTTTAVDADSARADGSAARISAGMNRLGASPDRSECFADKIASALDGPDANEAVEIIETSTSKAEMRSGVLGASTSVKQSFIRAHFGCSFFD